MKTNETVRQNQGASEIELHSKSREIKRTSKWNDRREGARARKRSERERVMMNDDE